MLHPRQINPLPSMAESTNFSFLSDREPDLYRLAQNAERVVHSHPRMCLKELRTFGEMLAERYVTRKGVRDPSKTQFERLKMLQERGMLPRPVANALHSIRMAGNDAQHENKGTAKDALQQLRHAQSVAGWFCRTAHGGSVAVPSFVVPDATAEPTKGIADDVQALQQRLEEIEEARTAPTKKEKAPPRKDPEVQRLQARVSELESMKQRLAEVEASSQRQPKRRTTRAPKPSPNGPGWAARAGSALSSGGATLKRGLMRATAGVKAVILWVVHGIAAVVRRVYGWVRRVLRFAMVVSLVATFLFYLPGIYAWSVGLLPAETQDRLPPSATLTETHRRVLPVEHRDTIEETAVDIGGAVVDAVGGWATEGADAMHGLWKDRPDPQQNDPSGN